LKERAADNERKAAANDPASSGHFALEVLDHVQQSVQMKRLEKDAYIRRPTRSAKPGGVVRAIGQDRNHPRLHRWLKITEAIDELGSVGRSFRVHHDQIGAITVGKQLHGLIGGSAIADVMSKLTEKSCGRRSI
jgi:hypothetical protein